MCLSELSYRKSFFRLFRLFTVTAYFSGSSCFGPYVVLPPRSSDVKVVGPLYANVGEDLVLPCSVKPSGNAEGITVEWTRAGRMVHQYKDGTDIYTNQMASYKGRTSLSKKELKKGNASLLLRQLRVEDIGGYTCKTESKEYALVIVVVKVVGSQPVITLDKVDGEGFSLLCQSDGWIPNPAVDWLDGEGRRLPSNNEGSFYDHLTVKQRMDVDKLKKNSTFICRVSGEDQMKETMFHINEGWFHFCDSSAHRSLIAKCVAWVLAAICVCLLASTCCIIACK
ncbi:butyrophilin-like protein 2 [Sardina pilchardus]|uniref:butyrophilin-like protein 2 n=1 Tax=Sardina pilchardus TaxID=27697 RepID=UPI002E1214B9